MSEQTPPSRPAIVFTGIDMGPADLAEQLPLQGSLLRILPGSDRPDYSLAMVEKPIRFHATPEQLAHGGVDITAADPGLIHHNADGTVDLLVYGLVLCARIAGETIHLSMKDFPVNVAYVIDNTQMRDTDVVFAKSYFAAVAFLSMDETPREASPAS